MAFPVKAGRPEVSCRDQWLSMALEWNYFINVNFYPEPYIPGKKS